MPELPDVAHLKRYLDATALHQPVERVDVRDSYVLKGISASRLREQLEGTEIDSSTRHGKNLLVELTGGACCLRLHFGMTGSLRYYRDDDAPQYTRVLLDFDNGYHLAYVCPRKLGRVSIAESAEAFVENEELGPDALEIGRDDFLQIMRGRRGALKTALMNQQVIAGLGNVYSDEILYQAGLLPTRKVGDLDEDALKEVYRVMQRVLKASIERNADAEEMPRAWLIHNRGKGETCPRCGTQVRREEVSGRGCYFCPGCQQ